MPIPRTFLCAVALLAACAQADTLYLTIDFRVPPEKAETFLAIIEQGAPDTRGFDGCLQFDVYQDRADPGHFVFYEVWASEADRRAYQKWRATTDLGPALYALVAQPPVSHEFNLVDPR